ncbi:Uncharacterised protein [Mycobacterium tuberculosis]|nr:Uncharacterised protein [Mycobacterium tuberculosis]
MHLRCPNRTCGQLGHQPVDRPQLAELPRGDTRDLAVLTGHSCFTRYGDTVLRCSSRSSARPKAGKARCGQLSRSQTRQPAPIGVAAVFGSPDKSSPSE